MWGCCNFPQAKTHPYKYEPFIPTRSEPRNLNSCHSGQLCEQRHQRTSQLGFDSRTCDTRLSHILLSSSSGVLLHPDQVTVVRLMTEKEPIVYYRGYTRQVSKAFDNWSDSVLANVNYQRTDFYPVRIQ
jgi:hypothetical protein